MPRWIPHGVHQSDLFDFHLRKLVFVGDKHLDLLYCETGRFLYYNYHYQYWQYTIITSW